MLLQWFERGTDYLSTYCGRFDVFLAGNKAHWVALDSDYGRVRRFPTLEEARAWCEQQLKTKEIVQ